MMDEDCISSNTQHGVDNDAVQNCKSTEDHVREKAMIQPKEINNKDPKSENEIVKITDVLKTHSTELQKATTDDDAFSAMMHLRRYLSEPLSKAEHVIGTCNIEPISTNKTFTQRIDETIEKNILPIIKTALDPFFMTDKGHDLSDTQVGFLEEAFWFLTNVASGDKSHTRKVIDLGFVPYALRIVESNIDVSLTGQCFMLLTNIIDDFWHGVPITYTFLHKVIDLIQSERSRVIYHTNCEPCCQAIENQIHALHLCYTILKTNSSAISDEVLKKLLLMCVGMLQDNCLTIHIELLQILFKASSDKNFFFIELMQEYGFIPEIIAQINHANPIIRVQAIKVAGNLLLGTDAMTWPIVRSQLLTHLPTQFNHDCESVRQILWLLSDIADCPSDMLNCLFDFYILPYLQYWLVSSDPKTMDESIWVAGYFLNNITKEQKERVLTNDRYNIVASIVNLFLLDENTIANKESTYNIAVEILLHVVKFIRVPIERLDMDLKDMILDPSDRSYQIVKILQNDKFVKRMHVLEDRSRDLYEFYTELTEIIQIILKP